MKLSMQSSRSLCPVKVKVDVHKLKIMLRTVTDVS